MKCQIPEISWHNRDPVLSVDIQPRCGKKWRLASGGTDSHVLIWYLQHTETGQIELECAADLARHQRAVNVVRWSPNGELLASGDDESVIFIWKLKGENEAVNILDDTNEQDKEIWITLKILRGHMEDVYDLAWSPSSSQLISASVDNTAMIWDVTRGKHSHIFQEHQGFVQGVTWDPQNKYVATLSSDRNFRVFSLASKKMLARSGKGVLPVPKDHFLAAEPARLYHDDTLQSFFRRLSFSPDGSIVVAPAGVANEGKKPVHTTYIYTRNNWKTPAIVLPSPDQYTVATRFCPLLFKLDGVSKENPPVIPLPYRMIFAVATRSSVYLYDTQQKSPFAVVSNIHYARLTDLAWSEDGEFLIVSSTDGFCSIIVFEKGELGEIYDAKSKNLVENVEPVIIEAGDKIIEIPCDKILSVDQKFASPEKKETPVTPIAVRRHPRTNQENEVKTPPKDEKTSNTPKTSKTPQPIAIRRQPRVQASSQKAANNEAKVSQVASMADEAVDAWPIDEPKPLSASETFMSPGESDKTQDIHLVVEDDEGEAPTKTEEEEQKMEVDEEKETEVVEDAPKTPRRVEFRTISTPKSKKKLL
ncbi:chromatin assembly factor 1 subunit B [Culicoides brevitarsis]|uniref:chromatin assembly factor 1 subunit B n=1 Tax=Culicoides brevitarsis TaxID=469753 RepID=UPI00307BB0AE